jgi:hypothetical protein
MLLALLCGPASAPAHEEKLVIGRVEVVDLDKKVLVVVDAERDRTVQLVLDDETEVRRCRHVRSLATLRAGTQVRVKYLDRPGSALEALSILMLPDRR